MSVEVIKIFITRMLNINNKVVYNRADRAKIGSDSRTTDNNPEILSSISQLRSDKLRQLLTFGFKIAKNNMKNFSYYDPNYTWECMNKNHAQKDGRDEESEQIDKNHYKYDIDD